MQSLIEALTSFNTFLAIPMGSDLSGGLNYFDKEKIVIDRYLFNTTLISDEKIEPIVRDILPKLGIPKEQWGRYIGENLTVYDFLVELSKHNKKNNAKIKEFIDFIDDKATFSWTKIFFASILALITAEFALPFIGGAAALSSLQTLFAAALFAPIVGAVFTSAIALYSLYQSFFDKKTPLLHRLQDNFFVLAYSALRYAGYGVLIAAAVTVSPLAAILFVVAEAALALKEISSLVRMVLEEKRTVTIPENAELSLQQHQARHELDYVKRRNTKVINIVAAVVLVGVVAASVFIPGGIFVTAGAIAAIMLVTFIQKWANNRNTTLLNERLQGKFEELERDSPKEETLQFTNQLVNPAVPGEESSVKPSTDAKPSLNRPTSDDRKSRVSQVGAFSGRGGTTAPGTLNLQQQTSTPVLEAESLQREGESAEVQLNYKIPNN